jgi:uncharacterized protein YpiB (UPF0302 family)
MNLLETEAKKELLSHFSKFPLKDTDASFIIRYISRYNQLLENIHFVENASKYSNHIIVTADGSPGIPLIFSKDGEEPLYKGRDVLIEVQRNSGSEEPIDIFVELNYTNKDNCPYFRALVPKEYTTKVSKEEIIENASLLIRESEDRFLETFLLAEIDATLQEGDKEKFLELTCQLEQLRKRETNTGRKSS